jgi:transposase
MVVYAGLDVSDSEPERLAGGKPQPESYAHICVVDGDGAVLKRDVQASDPDVLAKWLKRHCPGLVRVVRETCRNGNYG